MVTTLWKIKPGKRQLWVDWCRSVSTVHHAEAVGTLTEEQLIAENCQVFGEGDNSYVVYHHVPVLGKHKLSPNLTKNLNVVHLQIFKECLEKVGPSVEGYDLHI